MKIEFARWVRAPGAARHYFLYGSEEGYLNFCREMLVNLLKAMKPGASVQVLSQELVFEDVAVLENQPSLFDSGAAEKIIVIESATDKALSFVEQADPSVTLVFPVLAGTAAKKLKDMHENSSNFQLISCYLNTASDKAFFVNTLLQRHDLQADHEALQFLIQRVDEAADVLETDMAKCSLYGSPNTKLTLDDVQRCFSEAWGQNLQGVIDAVGAKDRQQVVAQYENACQAGVEDIVLLRMLGARLAKLLGFKEILSQGRPIEEAMRLMRPPIFFKDQAIFKMQLAKWSVDSLLLALDALRQREQAIKLGAVQADTSLGRFLIALTTL